MKYIHYITMMLSTLFLGINSPILTNAEEMREYDIKNIPNQLISDAGAIVRINNVQFEIKNKSKAIEKITMAITIFKKEERHYGELILWYDKFREIEDLDGKIFNAAGEEIRELNDIDIKDYSAFSQFSLYADSRVRVAKLYYDQYPYTVEFSYEISYDGSLNWPVWFSQISLDPIEHSRFEVISEVQDSIRYWVSIDSVKPDITIDGKRKTHVWESKNLPKLSRDVVGDDIEDVATMVRIAPSLFEIGDYEGDMRTWKDFGKWDYQLFQGKDLLPESAKKDIHNLIGVGDTDRNKIEKLYSYMQNRTRYVSVQLGIGGWQPFDATYVHERGYGDCKALSNYMVALLKEVNIKAYPVLIQPGDHRYTFIQDFSSNQFTHVIVCVPLEQDTLWLECTSQSIPMGHLGKNNENRCALLISPDGGIVVRTPSSISSQNRQQRTAIVKLTNLGFAEVTVSEYRTGNQQDYLRNAMEDATPEDRERWILNHLDVPSANLSNYILDGLKAHGLELRLSLQLSLPKYASISGDRLFFQANLMEKQTYVPPVVAQRLSPIRFSYPFLDIDSINYIIPNGMVVESLPKEIVYTSSFGEYKSKALVLGDNSILYTRSLQISNYSIPAKDYSEYRNFYADIVKADRAQIVLIKKK